MARVVWSEVIGLCGFWDGSCDNGKCGVGILIQAFAEALGWIPIYKKCGPVVGQNSLDAELGGCGVLTDDLRQWIDKCVRWQQLDSMMTVVVSLLHNCIFRWNALHTGAP